MRKIREEIDRNEELFPQLSDKVDKNKMPDAGIAAEFQGLQAGEERKGSNASQAVDCCMETMVDQFIAMGADQAMSKFDAVCARCSSRNSRPMPLLCRCQGKKEEEGTVKANKSKTKPISNWRCQRQAGAMKALQRALWSLIFLGFGLHLVNAEEQGCQVQQRMIEKDFHQTFKSTSHGRGRGCCTGRLVKGKMLRGLNSKKRRKKRETARERTQEPSKNQWKGGEFKGSERRRSGGKRRRNRIRGKR